MDYVKLSTFDSKRLLLFPVIYAVAFLSFWLYSSKDVWMFFCCLLSYCIQVICIPFLFMGVFENKQVKVTADNLSTYAQKEDYYKIIFVLLSVTTILFDSFPFAAMSGIGNIPEYEGGLLVTIMVLGIWCMWGFCIAGVVEKDLQKEYDNRIASEKKEKARLEQQRLEKERIEAEFNNQWQELSNKYGECTTDICIGASKDIKQHLYVFEESAVIVLNGEEIAFNKILGFVLQDDSKTIMTSDVASYTSSTKTSTSSMIGRAAVAGMLTGGLGAVIGAATAKKETTITPNQSKAITTTLIKHNYICYVNVNDLTNPIREILLGGDPQKAQMVANIFNVIIERNK